MVKHKIEALLFSSGRKMSVEEISRLCRQKAATVIEALKELKDDYSKRNSSLMLVEEGNFWKITVREQHLGLVRNIVTETELSKSVIETLAVIAFKYPIKQCDLIKIRTNKAYDHLSELEKAGYITRQKHGRTKLIKLTQKFFEYFDLPEEKLKDHFRDFESIARAIGEKEKEVDKIKDEQKKKAEDAKKEDERIRHEIGLLDNSEQLGNLEVYESAEEKKDEAQEKISEDSTGKEIRETEKIMVEHEAAETEENRITEGAEEKILDERRAEKTDEEKIGTEVKENIISSIGSVEKSAEEAGETYGDEKEPEPIIPEITDDEFEKEIKKPLKPEMQKRVDEEIGKMLNPSEYAEEESGSENKQEPETEKPKEKKNEEPKDLLEAEMEEQNKQEN